MADVEDQQVWSVAFEIRSAKILKSNIFQDSVFWHGWLPVLGLSKTAATGIKFDLVFLKSRCNF